MKFDLNKRHCYYFNEIAKIPHGSKNEKALSDYIVGFAKEYNLKYLQDELYNVVIYKDKTSDSDTPLLIQAHIDMVCEKNLDSNHDFITDPLDLYVEDGFLKARGTTLGADDGHGVSYMLAILSATDLKHPPLECAFTTQEEIGMFGAMILKPEYFKAKQMITLDGGGETSTLLSSAGGSRVRLTKKITKEQNEANTYKLMIKGLTGGHSGGLINKEKGNANKLLVRVLAELQLNKIDINLVSLDGGLKDNAIPREAVAFFTSNVNYSDVETQVNKTKEAIVGEYSHSDNGVTVTLEKAPVAKGKMTRQITDDVIRMLYLAPNGLQVRSMAIEGLTLTSLNLGVVNTEEDIIRCTFSLRSAIDSSIEDLSDRLTVLADVFNFNIDIDSKYPGWNFTPTSHMRDVLKVSVQEVYGVELVVKAAHGGCECGVFNALIPNIDIVSIGPLTDHIHTPDEQMDLASFDRVYDLLANYIGKL